MWFHFFSFQVRLVWSQAGLSQIVFFKVPFSIVWVVAFIESFWNLSEFKDVSCGSPGWFCLSALCLLCWAEHGQPSAIKSTCSNKLTSVTTVPYLRWRPRWLWGEAVCTKAMAEPCYHCFSPSAPSFAATGHEPLVGGSGSRSWAPWMPSETADTSLSGWAGNGGSGEGFCWQLGSWQWHAVRV